MQIILAISDKKGKNILFILDNLTALSLDEIIIKDWSPYIDLRNKQEIIATLYSLSRKPHPRPVANGRGKQIASELYKLAKRALH